MSSFGFGFRECADTGNTGNEKLKTRSQSYDFVIYNYNASTVIG
jgi:hypothetical protein